MRYLICRCPETHQPVNLQLYTESFKVEELVYDVSRTTTTKQHPY